MKAIEVRAFLMIVLIIPKLGRLCNPSIVKILQTSVKQNKHNALDHKLQNHTNNSYSDTEAAEAANDRRQRGSSDDGCDTGAAEAANNHRQRGSSNNGCDAGAAEGAAESYGAVTGTVAG